MTKTRMSSNSDITTPFDTIVASQEAILKARLIAGGPQVALESESALIEYRRVATALRLVVEQQPPADDISDDFIEAQFERQLARDAGIIATNAEGRANSALHVAHGVWKGILDGERSRQRWAKIHAMQAGGTR